MKKSFLFKDDPTIVGDKVYSVTILSPGSILRSQRFALGLFSQEVAEQSEITLEQYVRLEEEDNALLGTSFQIGLRVCRTLKLDPYDIL